VTGWHQDPEGVLAEQQQRDVRRGERSLADADIQAAVGQLLVLPGHAGLCLVDDQAGVAGLDLVQDQRHRIVTGVDDPGPQRRRRTSACPGLRLSGCAGMKRSGQMLIPPVASRAIAAAAMRAVVSHPRMVAAVPFT
jgi:hypothetical protein